ncbi:MAG TPA: hypothetical protein ENL38_02120 [Candidatus Aminicenantes bacterium]|nr:hypothetical protein [Candidatus Aminicenantes bacterium]
MKVKKTLILIIGLSFLLAITSSCKRSAVEEPSPVGPSTLAVLLKLTTSTNVLFAGLNRQTANITAVLQKYDGTPLSGRTIYFEIRDAQGLSVYYGFFNGKDSSASAVTNSSGEASVVYYGPLAQELTSNEQIYIYAIVAGSGKEYIVEKVPIYLIRDLLEFTFTAYANPNVLWCTSEKPESIITAEVKLVNGVPLYGAPIHVKILSGRGEFENGKRKISTETDNNGLAQVTYIGPTKSELPGEWEWVQIRVFLENAGQTADESVYRDISIRLEKGSD